MKISNTNLFYLNDLIARARVTNISEARNILSVMAIFEEKVHGAVNEFIEAYRPFNKELEQLKEDENKITGKKSERASKKEVIEERRKEIKALTTLIDEKIVEVNITKEEGKAIVAILDMVMWQDSLDNSTLKWTRGKGNIELLVKIADLLIKG